MGEVEMARALIAEVARGIGEEAAISLRDLAAAGEYDHLIIDAVSLLKAAGLAVPEHTGAHLDRLLNRSDPTQAL
jgi:hypothetical protein